MTHRVSALVVWLGFSVFLNRIIEQDKKTNSTVIALDLGSRHLPIQSLALVVEQANTRFTAATAKPVRRPMISRDWCRGWIFLNFRRWFVDPSKSSSRKSPRSRGASVLVRYHRRRDRGRRAYAVDYYSWAEEGGSE